MTEDPQDRPAQSDPPQQPSAPPPAPPMAGQTPAYGAQGQQPVSPSDARMWSLFAQIGGIFFSFIPSLVIYLIYKDRDPFIRRHSAQALSFQIVATIALIISAVLQFVLIGYLTGFATWVCILVFSIKGAIAANKGDEYTYPLIPKIVT
jgi:uncharacterized Tic20 family protein